MKGDDAKYTAALIERVGRLVSTEAHAEGLLPVQWEALRYLHKANRFSRTAAALTAYLGITKGTVSQTLKTLGSKGLLAKHVDAKDRRIYQLSLTAKGRKLLRHDPLNLTVVALEHLGNITQGTLKKGLQSLLTSRLDAQDRKPFGQCQDCQYFARRHPDGNPHFCQLLQEQLAKADSSAICHEQVPA